ncbi:MAG: LysM peptidoglycan-binding domain-containing protein [Nitrospirota bacterium]
MKRLFLFIVIFVLTVFISGSTYADMTYTVKRGDTLSAISKKYSISISELKEINNLRSAKLKIGQQLLVKRIGPRTYIVKKGDNIWKIARKFDIDVDELKDINGLETDLLKPGQKLLLEPEEEVDELKSYGELVEPLSEAHIEEEIKKVSESEELGLKERLIIFAKKLLNIPYRFGGSSLMGIDCSAYVQKVYGLLGIDLPRSAREQFHVGETVEKDDLSIGDLVFFRTYASFPSHVGIYLGNNLFIHASSKNRRVTIDSLKTPYYFKRFIGAKRLITHT